MSLIEKSGNSWKIGVMEKSTDIASLYQVYSWMRRHSKPSLVLYSIKLSRGLGWNYVMQGNIFNTIVKCNRLTRTHMEGRFSGWFTDLYTKSIEQIQDLTCDHPIEMTAEIVARYMASAVFEPLDPTEIEIYAVEAYSFKKAGEQNASILYKNVNGVNEHKSRL